MISLDKLAGVQTILTHDSCPDGTASAIILRDAFSVVNHAVEVRFVQYGSDEHKTLEPAPGQLFCDITPTADRARAFADAGAIVLDHHRTARAVVEQFGENGVFADEATEPGVCGAVLAYREVWKQMRPGYESQDHFIQYFATLAGIRDTWQRRDPRWEQACAQASVLNFVPNEKWLSKYLGEIASTWEHNYRPLGELLQEKQAKDVARMAAKGWPFTTNRGTRVLIIPSKGLTSDVAELLDSSFDLIAGFGYTYEPEQGAPLFILSTRSHTNFDCATFCKAHGGGGHTKAAGCSFLIKPDDPNPYVFIERLIRAYDEK